MALLTKGGKDFLLGNKPSFKGGKKTVTTAGTAEQLPNQAVPDGFPIVIKALQSNTDKVNVGESKANAEDDNNSYELNKNETVTLLVDNINRIWVDSDVNGEGITYAIETES